MVMDIIPLYSVVQEFKINKMTLDMCRFIINSNKD